IGERELRLIFNVAGESTINVGHLQQDRSIGAYVDVEEMVQKHFAIFGSTGAGKSSGVALILREIMAAQIDLRVLLIDPHNEYASCFEDKAHVLRPGTLRLPYWLFGFDEIVEVIFGRRTDVMDEIGLLSELIPLAKNEYARSKLGDRTSYRQLEPDGGRYTADSPVPYRMEDLVALADHRLCRHLRQRRRVRSAGSGPDRLRGHQRSRHDLFRRSTVGTRAHVGAARL
ncbi:MAG: ATP-binding protein, partial [Pseudomonadota bacterium]